MESQISQGSLQTTLNFKTGQFQMPPLIVLNYKGYRAQQVANGTFEIALFRNGRSITDISGHIVHSK